MIFFFKYKLKNLKYNILFILICDKICVLIAKHEESQQNDERPGEDKFNTALLHKHTK